MPKPPLKKFIERLHWLRLPPLLAAGILAIGLTSLAGWLAITLSQEYHSVAPYHYDSVSYNLTSVFFYNVYQSEGFIAALQQSLQSKDSLDVTLRLLVAPVFPQLLLDRYGHMSVLLPFMALFIFLNFYYLLHRTRSILLGLSVVAFLFIFPLIYSPYGTPSIGGIADYWKDNLAVWLFGSAIITWLLSRRLAIPSWSFLCGLFLGLLVMQRTAVAIYVAVLFLPIVLLAIYQRINLDGSRQSFLSISIFTIPAALITGVVLALQWQSLYNYYFVAGYAYGSPQLIADSILSGLNHITFLPFTLMLTAACLLCAMYIITWCKQYTDILIALWFVIGFPFLIIMTSTFYLGFYVIWSILLIVLLATLMPINLAAQNRRQLAIILFSIALPGSVFQYYVSSDTADTYAKKVAPLRELYDELADIVIAQQPPRRFAFFFDEVEMIFRSQLFYDNHIYISGPSAFMSIHDTYYQASYGNLSLQDIADKNINLLEQHDGTIAVGYCEPADVLVNPSFQNDGLKTAAPYAFLMNEYLYQGPNWKAIHKINSPYGCLYAYRYSKAPLSDTLKWQDVTNANLL